MSIVITITDAPQATIPQGYGVFRVRGYPIHGYSVDLDAVQRDADMWAVVPVWVLETKTWSAVKGNYSVVGYPDISNLWKLQPNDGHALLEKIGWLVHGATAADPKGWGYAPMWTGSAATWSTAKNYYVGSQLWAGQLCVCSLDTFSVNINGQSVMCRKVYPFQKADWQTSPEVAPWLYPWVTIASKMDNSLIDHVYDRGKIRVMQQVLTPTEYPFASGIMPSSFYVPVDWVKAE